MDNCSVRFDRLLKTFVLTLLFFSNFSHAQNNVTLSSLQSLAPSATCSNMNSSAYECILWGVTESVRSQFIANLTLNTNLLSAPLGGSAYCANFTPSYPVYIETDTQNGDLFNLKYHSWHENNDSDDAICNTSPPDNCPENDPYGTVQSWDKSLYGTSPTVCVPHNDTTCVVKSTGITMCGADEDANWCSGEFSFTGDENCTQGEITPGGEMPGTDPDPDPGTDPDPDTGTSNIKKILLDCEGNLGCLGETVNITGNDLQEILAVQNDNHQALQDYLSGDINNVVNKQGELATSMQAYYVATRENNSVEFSSLDSSLDSSTSTITSQLNQVSNSVASTQFSLESDIQSLDSSISSQLSDLTVAVNSLDYSEPQPNDNSISASTCSSFSCSGDPIACFLARQSWETDCSIEGYDSSIFDSEINSSESSYSDSLTQIFNDEIADLDSSRLASISERGDITSMFDKYNNNNGFNIDVEATCPDSDFIDLTITTLEISYQPFCDISSIIRVIMIAMATLVGFSTLIKYM